MGAWVGVRVLRGLLRLYLRLRFRRRLRRRCRFPRCLPSSGFDVVVVVIFVFCFVVVCFVVGRCCLLRAPF